MSGKIVADGTHEGLLATTPSYREVLARAEAEERAKDEGDDEDLRRLREGERLMGGGRWVDGVPEETLSRDEAKGSCAVCSACCGRTRLAIVVATFVLMAQVGALLAGPAAGAVRHRPRHAASTVTPAR